MPENVYNSVKQQNILQTMLINRLDNEAKQSHKRLKHTPHPTTPPHPPNQNVFTILTATRERICLFKH